MKIVALYPGRFQPFGKHHYDSFKWLQSQFGAKNSYIVTSDKVAPPKSPLSFKEKKEIMSMYGISHVINTTSPYKLETYPAAFTSKYDPKSSVVVYLVGSKDMGDDPRFKITPDSYFQSYEKHKNNLQPYEKHAYLISGPHVSYSIPGIGEMSGTNIRKALSKYASPVERRKIFLGIFGWYDEDIDKMFQEKFGLNEVDYHADNSKLPEPEEDSITLLQASPEDGSFSLSWWADIFKEVANSSIEEGSMGHKQAKRHNAKVADLKAFLHNNIGREFVYDFDKFPKTVFGVKSSDLVSEETLIKEGGAAGHMDHPFNISGVTDGADLIEVFKKSIEYLKRKPASVKIDGVNASIRLVDLDNKKQFVMDRGSNKPLDVKGITKTDLQDRFGEGHGMIKVGGNVLDIFNTALNRIKPELTSLGMWNNPNVMFNMEYVEGASNVLSYGKNFLAIHGLLQISQITPTKRGTTEKSANQLTLQKLINKLEPVAKDFGFEVLGSVDTKLEQEPDLDSALAKRYTININDKKITKTLKQWLDNVTIPTKKIKLTNGKTVDALSKEVLVQGMSGKDINTIVTNPDNIEDFVNGYFTYIGTMVLGDEILKSLSSKLGDVKDQEGIVIRDKKISSNPFKITGSFIVKGIDSPFRK